MLVKTERFGEVNVSEEAMIHFPEGILGFEHLKRYVLIERTSGEIRFLQAVDDASLAFAVVDPLLFRPDYRPQLWEEDAVALGWQGQGELEIWVILTVPQDVAEMTANLMAPIILHKAKQLGRQVIQGHGEFSTRHRIVEELARAQRLISPSASPQLASAVGGEEPASMGRTAIG